MPWRAPIPVEERFWIHVKQSDPDLCWEWQLSVNRCGYGRVGLVRPKVALAHRVAWELVNGPIPAGLNVLHRCDNPPCVNPVHLFLGTQKDNVADMEAKGRARRPYGERAGKARLTESQVLEILRLRRLGGCTYDEMAAATGATKWQVADIVTGRCWKHLYASA